MRHRNVLFLLVTGGLLVFVGSMLLLTPQSVLASPASPYPLLDNPPIVNCSSNSSVLLQCGSQASSCKSCHEVQAEKPVNNDGTGWHESHAFGDFCIFCHAGNDQATDEIAAHTGMVPPLSDVKAACQQCHSADLMERAQVYASVLNVSLGSGDSTPIPATATVAPAAGVGEVQTTQKPPAAEPTAQSVVSAQTINEVVVNDPNAVDYVQRYNEIVLGERPVNWGNIGLIGLIGLVIVGGGFFVIFNEIRLRVPTVAMRTVEGEYPAEVLEMLPALSRLKLQTRNALKKILNNPNKTDKVLNLVDTLVSDESEEQTL